MKRFIRYLYEYEQGRRARNVGFVKVEQDDRECMIHIHGKGLHLSGEKKLSLYLFYMDGEDCVGIWQGEIDNIDPAVNYRLRFDEGDVGEPENFRKINGVILSCASGCKFAAVWDDTPADVEGMRLWTARPEEKTSDMPREPVMPEEQADEQTEMVREEQEEMLPEPELELAGEMTEMQSETVDEPAKTAERMPRIRQKEQNIRPWHVTKIQRKELAKLPRCEWRLANNNFLLHGYYNYRHLVFIENKQMMYLGVPGIFHEKEEKAAGTFGFPEFIPIEELNITLDSEECDTEEPFGYWCRQVRHL